MSANLSTDYLGLRLRTPLIIGASPFCDDVNVARQLEEGGAGAVVMRSLFEEQFEPPPARVSKAPPADPLESFPEFVEYQLSPDEYLRQLDQLKRTLAIPVIASLNGHRPGGWATFAPRLEDAGADAIELNFYQVVADATVAADQVETEMLETVGLIAGAVRIPIAVKLSPFHTAVAQLAIALELAGAAGVVVFNRFYQPDINIDEVRVQPVLRLSGAQELLLRLRWLAILSPQLRRSLAATGGIEGFDGVVKAILAGAHAVQVVSTVLRQGTAVVPQLVGGLRKWMETHGYDTVDQFRGLLNARQCGNPSAFERANYIRTLQSWKV